MSRERWRTVGLAAALAAFVLVPLGIWAGTSLSEEEDQELGIETFAGAVDGGPELVVSLPSEDLNTTEITGGAESVGLEAGATS